MMGAPQLSMAKFFTIHHLASNHISGADGPIFLTQFFQSNSALLTKRPLMGLNLFDFLTI